jgi:hypothetical protein
MGVFSEPGPNGTAPLIPAGRPSTNGARGARMGPPVYAKAFSPVTSCPTTRVCTSWVPS